MPLKITFVRHTAVDVPPGVCYGQSDVPLKETFPQEVAVVARNLMNIRRDSGKEFDAVYRSPLSRCRLLAEACGFPDAVTDERLLEMNFGEWEMRRYDEIDDPRLQEWYDSWLSTRATGGESFMDQRRRVRDFIREKIESDERNILLFTHAGVIISATLEAGLGDISDIFSQQPPFGGIVSLSFG